ncbi:MAG: hypothetical protein JRE82_17855 [Deltaproteobacteria bacterium]|nr:hypothetical protein [Deltaproteobacteria bacterium]
MRHSSRHKALVFLAVRDGQKATLAGEIEAPIHSQFGVQQGGVRGYVQFHVDLGLSREAARSAGFGICAIDNVSELHIASLEEFAQAASLTDAQAVLADEELFVDRPNSVMFTSDEIIRL